MALNYSHNPVLPTLMSDNKLASPLNMINGCFVEGIPEKVVDGYPCIWHASIRDSEGPNLNCGKDRADRCRSSESSYKDVVDLLPEDPFGMDIKTTFTTLTGWLDDLEVDFGLPVRSNTLVSQEGYVLFAGWNLLWNNALKFQFPNHIQFKEEPFVGNWFTPSNCKFCKSLHLDIHSFPISAQSNEETKLPMKVHQYEQDKDMGIISAPCDFYSLSICNVSDIVNCDCASSSRGCALQFGKGLECGSNFEGVPNEALAYSLSYLGVKDLLSVEMVCKSLFSAVRSDPLLWMTIHIDQPLNERITDDILEQLTHRASGNLQCLSLLECTRITDDGLNRILATNPKITKLSVPGCSRLSIESITHTIKEYNSNKDVGGIKHLRIGGLYGIMQEHFEELKLLVGVDYHKVEDSPKPHFYHGANFYLPRDDDRALDIEMCSKCEKFRLVYDCPAVGCQVTEEASQICRACTLCIARCAQCGRCVNDTEYEETFSLELVCSDCFNQLLQYQDRLDENVASMDLREPCDNFSLHG